MSMISFPLLRVRRFLFAFFCIFIALITISCSIGLFIPDPLEKVLRWPVSPVLLDSKGQLVHARLSSVQEWCLPIPLEEMGEWLPKTLVAIEDKRFYAHRGIDLYAIARAAFHNTIKGRVVSGGSTITSQLIRLSDPRPRTLSTKFFEFAGAWRLEHSLSKDQILELYLNRAPFGGPIRGVEAASLLYFGKRAKELSLGEAALLVGMLKGPTAYRPDRNPKASLKRRQHIIQHLAKETSFDPDMVALSLKEPLPVFKTRMPQEVWHFADMAFTAAFGDKMPHFQQSVEDWKKRKGQLFSAGIIHSTLDARIQALLNQTLQRQLLKSDPTLTAAGIVVANDTAEIVAYVGNIRFDALLGKEWVDCALSPRSPGSMLKPFAYMRAMERGLLVPATLLADTPLKMGGQAPRNYDRQFRGPVTAGYALAQSLNVPAVRVHRMLGTPAVIRLLREAGFIHLRHPEKYGDSLILGAGETTLLELARAFTAVARLGHDTPLSWMVPYEYGAETKSRTSAPDQHGFIGKARSTGIVGTAPVVADTTGTAMVAATSGKKQRQTLLWQRIKPHTMGAVAHPLYGYTGITPSGLASVRELLGERRYRQLHTSAATYLVTEILRDATRLPFIMQLLQVREDSPIAFKTGTSYGLRDAWTVAYTPKYTAVVWFGRSDGGADASLVGIQMAAPAAIHILRSLNAGVSGKDRWYEAPYTVKTVSVCSLSGAAPSPYCPMLKSTQVIAAVWRTTPCTMHARHNGQIRILWPPELEDFHKKRFSEHALSRPGVITSPHSDTKYIITPGVRTQPLALQAEEVTYPVYWFVGSKFIGEQADPLVPLYWLPVGGVHTVSFMDAQERTASSTIEVLDLGEQKDTRPKPLF